ncbi:hypothetical protein VE00_09284 [Pseudogymnoascus sp. WSF 3629]|nr:hypothetical protein VE00_09284 [Pseudogymnoascus sp. WSF 3629]
MRAPRTLRASPSPSTCLLRTSHQRPLFRYQQQSSRFVQMDHNGHNGRRGHQPGKRPFSTGKGGRRKQEQGEPFHRRLGRALRDTKIRWYPIPAALGIGFLGLAQLYKVNEREKKARREEEEGEKPYRRKRIRPTGPWQVQVMSTLPLKAMSRLWGRFNELVIPYYLRVPGFKLYSWIFGVNLSEVSEPDLHAYPNLAAFFSRTLRPGVRPLDPNPSALLSPADGRVLSFGLIDGGEVEQVKGMTYSLDALLGTSHPSSAPNLSSPSHLFARETPAHHHHHVESEALVKRDEEFAILNGIRYTLPGLLSGPTSAPHPPLTDASTPSLPPSEEEVSDSLAVPWYNPPRRTALYYCVIYLAPGDYHRFHSPTAWVAEKRRHFAGELYSVSPYLQRTLPGLFTLNERVALLGRWRHGFFSMTPVGATNVGSIVINFDAELRTNSLLSDKAADKSPNGYAEATYGAASRVLHGCALGRGEEMGGFRLGSTVVLVFEAPEGEMEEKEGWDGEGQWRKGGWNWGVRNGQRVKVGEALGWVDEKV